MKARTRTVALTLQKPETTAVSRPPAPTCPTCGCALHATLRTWEVVCSVCGEKRWPLSVQEPAAPYVCARCRVTSPEKREAARAAGKKSVESRRKRAAR
jgi:DNA-directed RNA polymerase subunit RPC12/RpoP